MSLFSLTSLFIFISSITFALLLYSRDPNSRINRAWLAMSVSIALWGLALFGVTSTQNQHLALLWQYLLDISAIYVPVLFLGFILVLTRQKHHFVSRTSAIIASALAIFSAFPEFKLGMVLKYDYYWINPGPYYIIFPIYFVSLIIISLYFLARAYHINSTDPLLRHQIKTTLIAGVIGFAGGITNFFPQVFNVYPFGNYFIILYVFLMSYGVLRYKLFNAKIISAQLFAGALVLITFFKLLLPTSLQDWFVNFGLFILSLVFSIFLVKGVYREVSQREKIESLAKQLENFIHFLSHEVKGILGKNKALFAGVLEGDFGNVGPDLLPVAKQMLKDTDDSVNMVINILQSSDLKNGKMTINKKPFDLKAEVETEVGNFKPDVEAKGLSLETNYESGDFTINGDKENIARHVIKNLLTNSLLYTPAGSISVMLKRIGKKIVFSIKDTGIGLSDKTKTNLFSEGGKGEDSTKTNVHSTGYGLFFAKGIVEAHGGRVWAESAGPGKGSTFSVEFDLV